MNFPVFDLHCDTAFALLGKSRQERGSLCNNELHIDLTRASTLPGYAQCFACFTSPMSSKNKVAPEEMFERQMVTVLREVEAHKDKISLAYSSNDIETNFEAGKMSAILTIEGPAGFGYDPALLEDLYKIGFRITTLGWNEDNVLTGSHVSGKCLTDLGREYVKEAQRLGMIVDVSHISDAGFWDIMDITTGPIIASHSNSRTLSNHSRNITDDMFRAIVQTGGVVGTNLFSDFLGADPTLDTVCDHIFHFINLDNDSTHIALGGDLDGCKSLPAGFAGIQDYPKLAERLIQRGLSTDSVMNIFWNNALGVMKKCCM